MPSESVVFQLNEDLPVAATDRSLPASSEAEEHVLACCLIDGNETIARCLAAGVTGESFYSPANRLIFQTIADLFRAAPPVTVEMLAEELKTCRQLEAVGGFQYLMQVTGKIPTTAHAGYFIEKVREKQQLRDMIKVATGTIDRAFQFTGGMDEFVRDTRAGFEAFAGTGISRETELVAKLEARRLKLATPPAEPVTRLYLAGKPVATPGNLITLIAKSKSGKTASVGGIIAAIIAAGAGITGADTLGFTASNPEGKALIVKDTEQSEFDGYACIARSMMRVGEPNDLPWLHPYGLAGWSAQDLRAALRPAVVNAAKINGGVFAVILDGVADYVLDVNDPAESNAFVAELHGLAIEFACSVICVIHSNEGRMAGDDGRGHLGKQLTRKAESNLLLKKVGDVTTITSEKQRKAPITEADGVAFKWSDDDGRHVSCGAPRKAKDTAKAVELRDLANEVFGNDRHLRRMELERRIGDSRNLKGNTPARRVDAMRALGVLNVNPLGQYERVT